jgi:hypothetical protein
MLHNSRCKRAANNGLLLLLWIQQHALCLLLAGLGWVTVLLLQTSTTSKTAIWEVFPMVWIRLVLLYLQQQQLHSVMGRLCHLAAVL